MGSMDSGGTDFRPNSRKSFYLYIEDERKARFRRWQQAEAEQRKKKVEGLKRQIEEGTYELEPEEAARKFNEIWNRC